jgi:hypothetical protein
VLGEALSIRLLCLIASDPLLQFSTLMKALDRLLHIIDVLDRILSLSQSWPDGTHSLAFEERTRSTLL